MALEISESKLVEEVGNMGKLNVIDLQLKIAQYTKEVEKVVEAKTLEVENYISSSAVLYGIKNVEDYVSKVVSTYTELLDKIIENYDVKLLNLIDSMKELEGNQMIALANFGNVVTKQRKILNNQSYSVEDIRMQERLIKYDNIREAVLEKYNGYNNLIGECLIEYNSCINEVKETISNLNFDQINSLVTVKQNIFTKLLIKIKSIFAGKTLFEKNIINKIMNQITELNNSADLKIDSIQESTVIFDLTLKKLKEKVSEVYELSIIS